MNLSARDIEIAARTVYGEARGEIEKGKIAVAWVIRNRAEHPGWWSRDPNDDITDDTIEAVCRDPRQFSCWNKDDPNREKILAVNLDSDVFRQCLALTAAVLANLVPDPTGGATHYHVDGVEPAWARGRDPDVTIGNHHFYIGVK